MKKILILYAHPAKTKSKINKNLISTIKNMESVTVHDLYSTYPDFMIDVEKEQKLCLEHDIIVFQFPFYWYSTPAILKEWQDLVLEHSWAYGSKGNALEGKDFLISTTAGGDDNTYNENGINLFTIKDLLKPFKSMSSLCKMNWIPPFTITGMHRGLPKTDIDMYSNNFKNFLQLLIEDKVDFDSLDNLGNYTKKIDRMKEVI